MRLQICVALLPALALLAGPVQAMSFAESVQAARQFDAQYQAARHERDAASLAVPLARSNLMPSVSFNASGSLVSGSREFPNALNQQVRIPVEYEAPQAALQMRTAIFAPELLARLRLAHAQRESAELLYDSRGLELVDRTVTAYLQVLLAHENTKLAAAEIGSLQVQRTRAEQRFERGEGTRTDVAQLQSALELARVRELEAADALDAAQRAMRRLTGVPLTRVHDLAGTDRLPALPAAGLDEWLALAEAQSPVLCIRRMNIEAASAGIERARTGHLPRLDAVATLSRSRNESLTSLNQVSTLKSIGLQFVLPIYSGGGVDATIRQAVSDRARAEEELRDERETVQVDIQRLHNLVVTGGPKLQAYARAVAAAEVTLEGATRAQSAGAGTMTEVVEARTRRMTTLRDLAQARYEHLAARARLMIQAGVPAVEIVSDVDRALTVETALPVR